METLKAVLIAEGAEEPKDEEELIEAWQTLIDTGLAWQLQGSFGRGAMHMIETGLCHAPASRATVQ